MYGCGLVKWKRREQFKVNVNQNIKISKLCYYIAKDILPIYNDKADRHPADASYIRGTSLLAATLNKEKKDFAWYPPCASLLWQRRLSLSHLISSAEAPSPSWNIYREQVSLKLKRRILLKKRHIGTKRVAFILCSEQSLTPSVFHYIGITWYWFI